MRRKRLCKATPGGRQRDTRQERRSAAPSQGQQRTGEIVGKAVRVPQTPHGGAVEDAVGGLVGGLDEEPAAAVERAAELRLLVVEHLHHVLGVLL